MAKAASRPQVKRQASSPRRAARPSRATPSRARAPTPPKPPAVSEATRTRLMAAAHEAARRARWGSPGVMQAAVAGVEVWAAPMSTSRPHWQLATHGLWRRGFELSLRVARGRDEARPPDWALSLLERQVRRALAEDAVAPDEAWCLEEATAMAPDSELTALTLTIDDGLRAVECPHARATVWQVVPLTRDEARLVREWRPSGLVELLRELDPALVTEPERASLLQSPRARLAVEQRVSREGSSLATMKARVSALSQTKAQATWRLSAEAVDGVVALLKGRTAHQRPFTVRGAGAGVEVRPGDVPTVDAAGAPPVIKLSQAASRQLRAQLRPRAGRYGIDALPGLVVEVV